MDCDKARRMISAYLDGEIPREARARLERHLARCAPCRHEKEEMEAAMGMLSSALPTVSLDLARAITSALPVVPRPRPVALRWVGAAAAILIAVGLFLLWSPPTGNGPDEIVAVGPPVGDFEGGEVLVVTSPDETKRAYRHYTRVRDGDLLENPGPRVARLGLDVGVDLALAEGTEVRVETRRRETAVLLEGDGEVIASLDPQQIPFVIEAGTAAGTFRVRAVGTIFSVAVSGGTIEVQVLKGTVAIKAPGKPEYFLYGGEVWVNGETVPKETTPPSWATPALPVIRSFLDREEGSADMDMPVRKPGERK